MPDVVGRLKATVLKPREEPDSFKGAISSFTAASGYSSHGDSQSSLRQGRPVPIYGAHQVPTSVRKGDFDGLMKN